MDDFGGHGLYVAEIVWYQVQQTHGGETDAQIMSYLSSKWDL